MKKKGFTLIELLAVIIILAVIALIATPIVLNVVEEAKKQANKNSVYGIMDSARLYYTESLLDGSKASNLNRKTNLIDEIKVSGKKPDSGVLYINNNGQSALAVIYDNVCYKKEFEEIDLTESEDIDNCNIKIKCSVTEGTGENIGDVITCGTESFYVYNKTGDNIKMLAKYNLKVGGVHNGVYTPYQGDELTYMQDENVKGNAGETNRNGTTTFSSASKKGTYFSSYEGSIVQGYVDKYREILTKMGVNVIDASLITFNELISLGCNINPSCKNAPAFIKETSYWTSSAYSNGSESIWAVLTGGNFDKYSYHLDNNFGVRPVITILESDLEV